jgi:hypothetical protein
MSSLSPPNSGTDQMDRPFTISAASAAHIVSVPLIDRWRIYHRLQELMIPCCCVEDGSLRVEVQSSTTALLLRSVVQQFVASRSEIVNWLERCWDAD